jgi:NTP pyrophosphatase (non-canonical NTP hydrolase)
MDLKSYQKISIQGLAIKDKSIAALSHRTLGLCGEAGAISNTVKKAIRDNNGRLTDADKALLCEKLGDTLFYIVGLADFADIPLEKIMQTNADKTKMFIESRKL